MSLYLTYMEIFLDQYLAIPNTFGNVQELAGFVNSGIPDHVLTRLYLVEDMTPPIIEISESL